MIEKVHIENSRCLRNVSVPLKPVTVLVGPNDSGKSVFLTGLHYLIHGHQFQSFDHWRCEDGAKPLIKVETSAGSIEHGVFGRRGAGEALRELLVPMPGYYQLPAGGVRMESSGYADDSGPPSISPDGQGVPSLVDYLLRRDRKRFDAFVKALRQLVPGLEELAISTPRADTRRLDLILERGLRIPPDLVSAGVRSLLFFVALAYHPDPANLFLVEEPETGVHPRRLKDVMELLRQVSRGEHGGRAAQVILTTHSPYLLDCVDLATDQVLVFRRCDDGSRTAEPADRERLKEFLGEFLLGEVWYNEGEAGMVAPKP